MAYVAGILQQPHIMPCRPNRTGEDDMADQLEGSVMFYRKPEPLSVEAHGHLRVRTADKPRC